MSRLFFFMLIIGLAASTAERRSISSLRDPRFFFKVITISPDACTTTSGTSGTCYSSTDCTSIGGEAQGSCALGLGVCCYVTQTCGSTITTNATSFINPTPSTTEQSCTTTINIQNEDICQIRLDFTTFDIKQPDINGECSDDFLMITGAANTAMIPNLCGYNTDQHLYFDVDSTGSNPSITIDTTGTDFERSWDIQVSKIPCGATYAAPSGCLQYFQTTSGTVKSFNYEDDPPTEAFELGSTTEVNLHLADLDYAVCIAPQDNYCSVRWSPSSETSFITQLDAVGNNVLIGSGQDGAPIANPFDISNDGTNIACTDYVGLFGGVDDNGVTRDRYCGLGFPAEVTTTSMPYIMYVVTDGTETGAAPLNDARNTGFSLDYRQVSC